MLKISPFLPFDKIVKIAVTVSFKNNQCLISAIINWEFSPDDNLIKL